MSTWYKTGGWRQLIEPVTVEKETEKSVWVLDQRWKLDGGDADPVAIKAAKKTRYQSYFKTWDEAHAYLVKTAESEVNAARLRLNDANGRLGNVKGLKRPESA